MLLYLCPIDFFKGLPIGIHYWPKLGMLAATRMHPEWLPGCRPQPVGLSLISSCMKNCGQAALTIHPSLGQLGIFTPPRGYVAPSPPNKKTKTMKWRIAEMGTTAILRM